MKLAIKRKIAGLSFGLIVMALPAITSIAAASSKATTIMSIYSHNDHAQAGAVVVDAGVAAAAAAGWLCGIQGAIMTIFAA